MAEKKQKAPAAKASGKPKTDARPRKAGAASRTGKAAPPATAEAAAAAAPTVPADRSVVDVVNADNEKIRELRLSPRVFGVKVNEHLLYEAVKHYRAGARAGTHMTKNRALVSGSGRKPWRQKGTGRARVGEIRNPLWRHGGTVFGPQPRDYSYAMPKKARAAALRSALSRRASEGAVRVVDAFPVDAPRTRILRAILDKLGVAGKTLLVDHHPTENLLLSGRNIPDLKVVAASHLTVYDVLDCRSLLVSQDALQSLEERLTP
jgi:large subunit ribosomal protein L4